MTTLSFRPTAVRDIAAFRASLGIMCGAFLAAPMAWAIEAETVHKDTARGSEVIVWIHQHFNQKCQSFQPPRVEIVRPPLHGRLEMRDGEYVNHGNVVGSSQCVGVSAAGVAVVYIPQPDFEGTDNFRWNRLQTGMAIIPIEATVTVGAPAAASAPATAASAN